MVYWRVVCFACGTFLWKVYKNSDIKSPIKLKISKVNTEKKRANGRKKCELHFGALDECGKEKEPHRPLLANIKKS